MCVDLRLTAACYTLDGPRNEKCCIGFVNLYELLRYCTSVVQRNLNDALKCKSSIKSKWILPLLNVFMNKMQFSGLNKSFCCHHWLTFDEAVGKAHYRNYYNLAKWACFWRKLLVTIKETELCMFHFMKQYVRWLPEQQMRSLWSPRGVWEDESLT